MQEGQNKYIDAPISNLLNNPVLYTVVLQILVVSFFCVFLAWFDLQWAFSLIIGGLIYGVPNIYFTWYAFRYKGACNAQKIAKSFSAGEAGKITLTVVGFALAFKYIAPLHVPSLLAGFGVLIILQWLIGSKVAAYTAQTVNIEMTDQ